MFEIKFRFSNSTQWDFNKFCWIVSLGNWIISLAKQLEWIHYCSYNYCEDGGSPVLKSAPFQYSYCKMVVIYGASERQVRRTGHFSQITSTGTSLGIGFHLFPIYVKASLHAALAPNWVPLLVTQCISPPAECWAHQRVFVWLILRFWVYNVEQSLSVQQLYQPC